MSEVSQEKFVELRKKYIAKYFSHLNAAQQKAVYTIKGPLLILAGAGSGKTTVLINRVANMVKFGNAYYSNEINDIITNTDYEELQSLILSESEPSQRMKELLSFQPVRPYNILAITFTNKAAGELKYRLEKLLPNDIGKDVNASTFHSACVRILRKYADKIGFPKSYTIYDSDDQKRVIKEIYKTLNIDEDYTPIKATISSIGRLKDKMISPKMALSTASNNKEETIAQIYKAYADKLKQAGAFDFDDLIYYTVYLFEKHEDALNHYQNLYKYIMVDEYQDTSIAQFRLVELLAQKHDNLCEVYIDLEARQLKIS